MQTDRIIQSNRSVDSTLICHRGIGEQRDQTGVPSVESEGCSTQEGSVLDATEESTGDFAMDQDPSTFRDPLSLMNDLDLRGEDVRSAYLRGFLSVRRGA